MALVEAVSRELGHEVEDILGLFLVYARLLGACHETLALLLHDLGHLLAHGPAQDVAFAQAVAGQHPGYLLHLLLVDDDPRRSP